MCITAAEELRKVVRDVVGAFVATGVAAELNASASTNRAQSELAQRAFYSRGHCRGLPLTKHLPSNIVGLQTWHPEMLDAPV